MKEQSSNESLCISDLPLLEELSDEAAANCIGGVLPSQSEVLDLIDQRLGQFGYGLDDLSPRQQQVVGAIINGYLNYFRLIENLG